MKYTIPIPFSGVPEKTGKPIIPSNKYKEIADRDGINHIFAIESDAGGFRPLGFSFTCSDSNFLKILEWKKFFAPYYVNVFIKGGSGAETKS